MYQRILIATDGSTLSNKAVESGLQLACLMGAQIFALKVVPRYPVNYLEGGMTMQQDEVGKIEKQWTQAAQAIVEVIKTEADAQGLKAKALTVSSDLIAETIITTAKKHKCDLIVMASHGRRGIKRILMGSETTHVLTHSHVPVLVLR
jgi:nucleotide-binding universal stress UspA family protein